MRHYNFPAREGVLRPVRGVIRKPATREEISIELWRKSIHVLIGFTPLIMSVSRDLAIAALTLGIFAYTLFEYLRMKGIRVPVISYITAKAARLRDAGKFVVGPITLGAGALLAILLFEPSQASVAIYILALGDGLSSLVGKALGHIRMPFSGGKSLEGTLMCFSVSFLAAVAVSGRPGASLIVAIVSTFVEALPTKDWDNIILPLAAGATAFLLGF